MTDKQSVETALQRAQLWFDAWVTEFEAQWNAQEIAIENTLASTAAKQFMAQTPPEIHQALQMQDPIEYQKVATLAQQQPQPISNTRKKRR